MAERGRPKIQLTELPQGWEDRFLELKAEGAADVEIRAEFDISKEVWYRWIEEEPHFNETVKKGEALCEAWWVAHGRKAMTNKDFNATLWYMNMKNRFGWKDKRENENNDTVTIKVVDYEGDKRAP